MKTFENLFMREDAVKLYVTYSKFFEKQKSIDSNFKQNFLNSLLSLSSTIAEGYEIDMKNVLEYIKKAKGELGKIKTLTYIGQNLGYFDDKTTEEILNSCGKIGAGLYNFSKSKK